jgi:hypothetical protein
MNRKLRLDLDALAVETFDTLQPHADRGTVEGHNVPEFTASCDPTCPASCAGSCVGSCVNTCANTCANTCLNSCYASCAISCLGTCQVTCPNYTHLHYCIEEA